MKNFAILVTFLLIFPACPPGIVHAGTGTETEADQSGNPETVLPGAPDPGTADVLNESDLPDADPPNGPDAPDEADVDDPDADAPDAPDEADVPDADDPDTPDEADVPDPTDDAEEDPDALYRDIAVLTEALLLVKNHYVSEKPYQELIHGAINGMLQALDPHSSFLDPNAFRALREDTAGHFAGIGIHVGMRNGQLTVIAPIDDSPAFRAGLLPGDRILRVDGRRMAGMHLERAVQLLRGERGSAVTLTLQREEQDPFEVSIERDDVRVASVRGVRMLNDSIGYVRVTQFTESTARDFGEALNKLAEHDLRGIVLDVRNNSGGLMTAAVSVAERLLPRGTLIVAMRGRDGEATLDRREAAGEHPLLDVPVAVLVNRGSASAAEIVAGALQDNRRGFVVGETTFGKASVQNIVPLRSNPDSAVRLTTGFYHTPAGHLIHGKGIAPDVAVTMPPSVWREAQLQRDRLENPAHYPDSPPVTDADIEDSQLERALDCLRAVMVFSGP